MEDYGIFEVKRDADGNYVVTEQLEGSTMVCGTTAGVGNYIREQIQKIEEESGK